jgi:hypothetical protein
MALNTFTFLSLQQSLQEACGDFLEFDTTSAMTASNAIVSTTLRQYDDGENGKFDGYWVYVTESTNAGVERKTGLPGTTTYATTTGTLTIMGSALTADSTAVTCRLTRVEPKHYRDAIVEATKELYPTLNKPVEDMTLITGNMLPDAHFEDWSSSSALRLYSTSNAAVARTSTSGLTRGGLYSAKVTPTAANGYLYISSDTYPPLLDLSGKTVNIYCWAYAEVTNDPKIEIYTIDSAGSTQTLTSTTACASVLWNQISFENQVLNDDLVRVDIRFKVASSTKYTYFDDGYLSGMELDEYLLPASLYNGHVGQVYIQNSGHSTPPCYDLKPFIRERNNSLIKHRVFNDGTYLYLKLLEDADNGLRLLLRGYIPLESLSAATSTITLDDRLLPLLIDKARMIFWQREMIPLSVDSRGQAQDEYNRAANDYYRNVYSMNMGNLARKM